MGSRQRIFVHLHGVHPESRDEKSLKPGDSKLFGFQVLGISSFMDSGLRSSPPDGNRFQAMWETFQGLCRNLIAHLANVSRIIVTGGRVDELAELTSRPS